MNRRGLLHLVALGTVGVALAGCGGGGTAADAEGDVLAVARANGLSRFARAAGSGALGETLAGPGPFTVFAPTDRAFAASDAGALDPEALSALLAYHVVPGQLTTDFLTGVDVNHTTLIGSSLNVDGTGATLTVNGAAVDRGDMIAGNGVVFAIDRVLTPR